jgi:GNAT superfamily N-acetyltransferase
LVPAPGEAIGLAHNGLAMRPIEPGDETFVRHLFKTARAVDFAAAGLPPAVLDTLLEQQFRAQSAGYAAQFPDASSLLIVQRDDPVGRLILHRTAQRWHIVDIVLLPAERGRGIGTRIIENLDASARQSSVGALTLAVLASNLAARRFYLRHGFVESGQAGPAHVAMRKDLA